MAPKIGPAVATLVALVVVLRKLLKSPAALRRFLGLEQVPPAELKFAPPNEAVPENVRGVWWIDAGPGVVTVDLNRLVPATSGEFYAQDAEPEYQTVSDDLTGLRLMLFATFCAVRSHVRVDADGPQVSWSLGRGALPLPLSSPSKRVDEHVVRRYIINSSGKTLASYFARRIIDAAGQKTEHLEAMLSRFSHVLQVLLSVDEVFWTVPGEEAEADTAQLHADQEDQSCFGQRSAVWRYPLPVFLRKTAEGTVEGLLHPPEADGVADGKAVRFCVRAVDPITGSTSMMGDLGPPIQLPSAAEVILRNVDAVNQIGEGAVRAGGFKRFLEDAEDAGLIGGEGTEVDLRKQLYEKVESAGGLESMLEALADLQMKNFKEACEVVRSIQESTELTAEETPSWQHVVKLVAGAGGAKKFTRSFTTVELAEVLGNTQQLAALGIFEGKSEDHTLRDALLTNDEHMPQFFSKIQEELGGLTLDERQVADLSSALGIMARRSKGNWTELVDLIAGEGGPTPVQPLVKYSEGHVQELHSAMQLSSLDAAPSSKL